METTDNVLSCDSVQLKKIKPGKGNGEEKYGESMGRIPSGKGAPGEQGINGKKNMYLYFFH